MARFLRTAWSLGVALAASTGCSDDASGPDPVPECAGPVSLSVSGGTEPTFDWSPRCRGFLLLVERDAADVWSIMTPGRNGLEPPVAYGTMPSGAELLFGPEPLVAGSGHDVILFRYTGPDEDDGEIVASRDFVP